jgi:hypothetical protein
MQHWIIAIIALIMAVVQLWMLCYFGQRVTDASDEIMNASFENNWMDETKCFKSSMLIIRTVCQKEIKVTAGGIHLCYESFYKVLKLNLLLNSLSFLNSYLDNLCIIQSLHQLGGVC